jgi:two-component system, LuxR family, response regulator FixJ
MTDRIVAVIDADEASRTSLLWMLEILGWKTKGYESSASFLADFDARSLGCVIADLRRSDMQVPHVLRELRAKGLSALPIVVTSGEATVAMAVEAMQLGALTFLEKPYPPTYLLELVDEAMSAKPLSLESDDTVRRYSTLTKREQEVLGYLIRGASSKLAARSLSISPRTVDVFRAKILRKMEAPNVAAIASRLATVGSTGHY